MARRKCRASTGAAKLSRAWGSPTTFGSTTTVEFSCRRPGADTFIDLIAETVHSATLNGTELDVATYTEEHGLPLPGLLPPRISI